ERPAQAPSLRIVHGTGDNERVRVRLNRMVNDTPERRQCRRLQPIFQRRRGVTDASKRAVQMQVRGVDKSQTVHMIFLSRTAARSGLGLTKKSRVAKSLLGGSGGEDTRIVAARREHVEQGKSIHGM